ncbi:MAG: hypothetical protein ACHQQR_12065, partial [Gemmatimonadales bacterium]
NKSCATDTVDQLLADAVTGALFPADGRAEDLDALLTERGSDVVGWSDWLAIDRADIALAQEPALQLERFDEIGEMLAVARSARES